MRKPLMADIQESKVSLSALMTELMGSNLRGLARWLNKLMEPNFWAYGLFWSWNIIFLTFMFLGFAPQIVPPMMKSVLAGEGSAIFLVYALILIAIPAIAIISGLTILRHAPNRLFALVYGVEAPLMLILAIRFFLLREVTPPLALLFLGATLGIITFLWQLLDQKIERRAAPLTFLRLIGLTLLLMTSLYAWAGLAFYIVPFVIQGGQMVAGLLQLLKTAWYWMPFWLLAFGVAAYSATLFILMPIAMPILYLRAWWRTVERMVSTYGKVRAGSFMGVAVIVPLLLFAQLNQQPQHAAFSLLEEPSAELQTRRAEEPAIRAGLLNAYLAPYRYLSTVGEVSHISQMYQLWLGISPEQAEGIQQLYDVVASPLLYQAINPPESRADWNSYTLDEESIAAASLYESFFDQTIVEGEREAINQAIGSTWSVEEAKKARLLVNDREVFLSQQEINIKENGDWADVELYEVYENRTSVRQEVVYFFSLPESAVITGLWLGNSPNRDERFVYRVSPRGAAQTVYRGEVIVRQQDPALLEQIGPRQYKLRIFPIEPRGSSAMHLWMTWRVLAEDNAWPMPQLADKWNVYWDEQSERIVNEKAMDADDNTWLPESLPAYAPITPMAHRVDYPGNRSIIIRPILEQKALQVPDDLKLALILDRSRSMRDYADHAEAALTQLKETPVSQRPIDVYLTSGAYRGEKPSRIKFNDLSEKDLIYYGNMNGPEMLAQFTSLYSDEQYDGIILLTDKTGYKLGVSEIPVPVPNAPLWIVHLGGELSLGYDDGTLKAIQASSGGVAGSLDEALERLITTRESKQTVAESESAVSFDVATDIIDGYSWQTMPTEQAEQEAIDVKHAPTDDFGAFAARQLILATMRHQPDKLEELETLNFLHAMAIENSIVSPYSSMIVLVTEEQERRLDQLEEEEDRFERESEQAGETRQQQARPITGVPEPEEWLLLALAAALLIWYSKRQRIAFIP